MKKTRKEKINQFINFIIVFISFLLLVTAFVIYQRFNAVYFEQLLFTFFTSEGTGIESIIDIVLMVLVITAVLSITYLIISILFDKYIRKDLVLSWKTNKKEHKIKIFRKSLLNNYLISIIIFIACFIGALAKIGFFAYLTDISTVSTIFEDEYVNPKDVNVKFPDKKRNLIYIYLESIEMTGVSKVNGGYYKYSLIPNLENLAVENINFSNTDKLGGFHVGYGGNWTIGALISSTAGIPLKISNDMRGNMYGITGESVPGAYSLGDMLKDNGYKNYFMMGSDASFGGRKRYLEQHGDYTIYDYYAAKDEGFIEDDYLVWWGYEDAKLFEYAKQKLTEISKNKEPFNFTLLTADTHFIDGYLDSSCEDFNFGTQYENVIFCNDTMVYKFIKWIQKQSFYKNTTIVIAGDHTTMQEGMYSNIEDNDRVVYNTFINSAIKNTNGRDKNRIFTNLDIYPTVLASLGVEIEGNRLGLGVNLYSDIKTLPERYGLDNFYSLLSHRSNYYIDNIMKSTYYDMLQDEMNGKNDEQESIDGE